MSSGYQTTLFSAIDPDVALNDRVVMLGDQRWAACLDELDSARWISVDTEFYEDGKGPFKNKDAIDYWKAAVRLLQIGLPSGRVIVCDFGGLLDDRERAIKGHWSALQRIKRVWESRAVPKCGMALSTEYLVMAIHFGWKMRCMRDIMLMSQVRWAGVASKGERWTEHGKVAEAPLKHDMRSIMARLGVTVDKAEQTSDWAGRLTNLQYNYAARDVTYPQIAWKALAEVARTEGLMKSFHAECDGQPPFCECEFNGLPVDPNLARANLAKWKQVRDDFQSVFRDFFPHVKIDSPAQVHKALVNAMDVRQCGSCGHEVDPLNGDLRQYGAWHLVPDDFRCPSCKDPKDGFALAKKRELIKHDKKTGKLRASTSDDTLAQYNEVPYVNSLLEGRSTSACLNWLQAVVDNMAQAEDGSWRIRTHFKQIAGGFSNSEAGDGSAGMGMGRSSTKRPLNTQNPSNLQPAHKKAGCISVRDPIRAPNGKALIIVDLSAAHARIAAQASQDPLLLRIFRENIDAHLPLAHRMLQWQGHADVTFDDAIAIYADPNHPLRPKLKSNRQNGKSIFYGSLNLQGPRTLMDTAATAPEPVYMTEEEASQRRDGWRQNHATLYAFQKEAVKRAGWANHNFESIGVGGCYGEVRALTGRRLFLIKNWQPPRQWSDGKWSKGRWAINGTDAVSMIWMGTEADLIKHAGAEMLAVFDEHPEYGALFCNMAHDEWDLQSNWDHRYEVAQIAQEKCDEAMAWAGVTDLPPSAGSDVKKLVVGSWAEK